MADLPPYVRTLLVGGAGALILVLVILALSVTGAEGAAGFVFAIGCAWATVTWVVAAVQLIGSRSR